MAARFILTLDCEGRWGVADQLTAKYRRQLGDQRLAEAYAAIIQMLDEYEVEATFAFVGAFTQSRTDFARVRPAIEELKRSAPDYLGPALRDLDESGGEGWHGNHLVDLVASARTAHEVALHGVTHVPWTQIDEQAAAIEMAIFEELTGPIRSSRTFVYPRNLVAHTDLLQSLGFEGHREARPRRSRAASLAAEFNIFEESERPLKSHGITRVPAGFFLNWKNGARALVPASVTRFRARRLLADAAVDERVVHYWLHPENIASAPSTLELLRHLLREVADAREAGRCEVTTQLAYCRSLQSLS